MNKKEIEQEIEWLQEEIDIDESIRGSDSFSNFHEQRIAETTEKLEEFKDMLKSI